jgi:hypothetical protein
MTHVRTRDDGSPVIVDTTSIIAMLYEAHCHDVVVTSDLARYVPDIDDEGYHLVNCVCDDCDPDRWHDA